MYVSPLNFNIVTKCLNLQDHQAKTHNYRKGLANLKNRATINEDQTLHSQKMKRKTLKQKIIGDHPTKKERKNGESQNQLEHEVQNGNK